MSNRAAELFSKFELGTDQIDNVEERVSDEELQAGLFLVIGAFSRAKPQEGSTMKALETWHGFGEVRKDRWITRSIRGRAHLNRLLLAQTQFTGLAFLNVETGEIVPTADGPGKFNLVDRKTGAGALLAMSLGISKDKGRAAGKGQAFHYTATGGRLELEKAISRCPELPIASNAKALPAPPEVDAEEGTDELEAETVEAGEPKKNGKRRR